MKVSTVEEALSVARLGRHPKVLDILEFSILDWYLCSTEEHRNLRVPLVALRVLRIHYENT
jgi:hypothetical protein